MIPGVMVDFLSRASVAIAGTRDERLAPDVQFLSGWSVHEDRSSVVCLLAPAFADGLVGRLERHGEIALTVEVIGPHECYQFKGRYLESRPASPSDRPVFEACRLRFVEAVRRLLGDRFSEPSLRARFRDPTLAVRFAVEEIYVQTPGPAAGRRLFPPEAS
jgi:hypothetical protein